MELHISEEAMEKLHAMLKPGDLLLLDNEDGDGPFVDNAVSCQLNTGFRLLVVSNDFDEALLTHYSVHLDTEIGTIRMKKSGICFLDKDNQLMIEPTYKRIQLRSPGGILANNVMVERKG